MFSQKKLIRSIFSMLLSKPCIWLWASFKLFPNIYWWTEIGFHPYADIPHQCMIKGDGRFLNIAAASVLAKTARDAYMTNLHKEYPAYQWDKNKGYPTRAHREAIQKWGSQPTSSEVFSTLTRAIGTQFISSYF